MTTHSEKGLTTLSMMGTAPENWKLAEIEWVTEEREIAVKVTCPTCHGSGRVKFLPSGEVAKPFAEVVPEPKYPGAERTEEQYQEWLEARKVWTEQQREYNRANHEGKCPQCPARRNWPSYGTGQVWGTAVREVTVGYPKWLPGTKFNSRFGGGCHCGLCNKLILKSNMVPVQGVSESGTAHGMWVGADCAQKFLAVKAKVTEERFFENGVTE